MSHQVHGPACADDVRLISLSCSQGLQPTQPWLPQTCLSLLYLIIIWLPQTTLSIGAGLHSLRLEWEQQAQPRDDNGITGSDESDGSDD